MEAPQSRIAASHFFASHWRGKEKKVVKPLGKEKGVGGLFFERFRRRSVAPCAGCGRISAGAFWMEQSAQLQSRPAAAAAGGVSNALDFTLLYSFTPQKMYPAALLLLLLLVAGIHADGLEGPTGKRRENAESVRAPAELCLKVAFLPGKVDACYEKKSSNAPQTAQFSEVCLPLHFLS